MNPVFFHSSFIHSFYELAVLVNGENFEPTVFTILISLSSTGYSSYTYIKLKIFKIWVNSFTRILICEPVIWEHLVKSSLQMSYEAEEGITQRGSLTPNFLSLILFGMGAREVLVVMNPVSIVGLIGAYIYPLKLPSADKFSLGSIFIPSSKMPKLMDLLMALNLAGAKSDYGNTAEGTESFDHPTSDQTQFGLEGKTASYGKEPSDPQESYETGTGTGDATGYGATPTGSALDETPLSSGETQPAGHGFGPEDTCKHHTISSLTFAPKI